MKKIILGFGLLYLARNGLNRRRRLVLRRQRRTISLAGFGMVAAGLWFAMRAMDEIDELPPRAGDAPWTSRKKQRREARIAQARAREQTTVRPPEVHVQKNADAQLKVRLGDVTR
jgi:hypothetical protein